ncbi:hypothetical protein LCGC14_2348760 [marine sediment metagenome]|uniref:Uncharacterized protein n=1 Tax=marine sediment metagenome TaxID=412755 RepID=A0A0F9C9P2_9ZZZZ
MIPKNIKDAIIEEQNKTINEEIAKRKLTTIDNKLSTGKRDSKDISKRDCDW